MSEETQEFSYSIEQLQLEPVMSSKIAHAVMLRKLATSVAAEFSAEDWAAVARLVSDPSIINDHPRLFRSLHFGDDDYEWCVQEVLMSLDDASPDNTDAVFEYLRGTTGQRGASSIGERMLREGESVRFRCDHDLVFVRELGHGGTGRTMLFKDETADLLFAIKKFDATGNNDPQECYQRFVQEAVILLRISHPHIVRVYNYYLYPQASTGYIQMEYVDGVPIDQFRPAGAKEAAQIFSDVVSAFETIEEAGVLHRDVRPANILVTQDGNAKLIDFGFGKQYAGQSTLEKNSVCLNWPYPAPDEVRSGKYDCSTEVYYVGKLFENSLRGWGIPMADFPYSGIIESMTREDPAERLHSFADVRAAMSPSEISPDLFSEAELTACRSFLTAITNALASLDPIARPVEEPSEVLRRLDVLLDSCMLEQTLPDASLLLGCVINGGYHFWKSALPEVRLVRDFRNVFSKLPPEKQLTVMRNIALRVEIAPREEEDVPF